MRSCISHYLCASNHSILGKNKLLRFAELETMQRVFQPGTGLPDQNFFLKGKWNLEVFHNNHPLIIELGCGRGEYTIGLAGMFPEKNFIGIDKKGARLWRGAKTSNEDNILNTAFLRIQATHLDYYFEEGELDEIWITFPDPQPQKSRERARMTSPRFLSMFRRLLKPNGIVHLKTDNYPLWEYSVQTAVDSGAEILFKTYDLYGDALSDQVLDIKTTYEQRFLAEGLPICYLKFRWKER